MNLRDYFRRHARGEPWHVERFARSAEWLLPHISANILEAGGTGVFTQWLRESGCQVTNTTTDLRYPLPIESAAFGLVLCMEVIEHVKDQEGSGNLATFDSSGIRCCLSELHRVCKPGGLLFLTTPNACCYRALQKIMQGEHPFMFEPHHRELAPRDVAAYVTGTGWQIERAELLSVWDDHRVSADEKAAFAGLARRFYGAESPIYADAFWVLARKC